MDFGDLTTPAKKGVDFGDLATPVSAAPETKTPTPKGEGSTLGENVVGGIFEPVLQAASGAVAKPLSDIAGLAATGKEMISPTPGGGDPAGFKKSIQEGLTYQPRTDVGRAVSEWNPMALFGRGMQEVGGKAKELIAPPSSGPLRQALGSGVEEAVQQIPAIAGAKGGAMAEARLPAKAAALQTEKSLAAPKDTIRDASQAAGYITPAEGGVKALLTGATGKAKNENIVAAKNNQNASRRFAQEVGIEPDVPLTRENIDNRIKQAYAGRQEMEAAVGPRLNMTETFKTSLESTLSDINDKLAHNRETNAELIGPQKLLNSYLKKFESPRTAPPGSAAGEPGIFRTLNKAAAEQPGPAIGRTLEQAAAETPGGKGYGGLENAPARAMSIPEVPTLSMSTAQVSHDISALRRQAREHFIKQDNAQGYAKLGVADQLEALFEENLSKTGNQALVDKFKADRVLQAKLHFIERVVTPAGEVDLAKVRSLSKTKAYQNALTGELKLAADFADTWKKAAKTPTGEAAPRLTVFDGLFALGSLGAGHVWPAAAEIGSRLAVPMATERGMMQNRTPSYTPGAAARSLPNALRVLGMIPGAENQLQNPPQ